MLIELKRAVRDFLPDRSMICVDHQNGCMFSKVDGVSPIEIGVVEVCLLVSRGVAHTRISIMLKKAGKQRQGATTIVPLE
jgi:hypothetical protein